MNTPWIKQICCVCLLLVTADLVRASSIGINFVGANNHNLSAGDFAGLGADAQDNWNNVTNVTNYADGHINGGSLAPLHDATGSIISGASMTVAAGPSTVIWPRPGEGAPWGFQNGDGILHKGGVYPQPSITLTGIPYENYDVYVIIDAGSGGGRGSASISVANGVPGKVDPIDTYYYKLNWQNGTYVKSTTTTLAAVEASSGSNYIVFHNNTASDITLRVDGLLGGSWTGVAAVQIVERPLPVQCVNLWRFPTDSELDQIKAAGFTHVRMGQFWEPLEQNVVTDAHGYRISSTYKWYGNNDGWGIVPVIDRITDRGLKVIFPLSYDHNGYPSVTSEPGRVAFANYAAACAAKFSDKDIIWEIWNEPSTKGLSDPDAYMALIDMTVPAMRAVDPGCTIISGGVVNPAWQPVTEWLNRCFELGLQNKVDGIGIHNYDGGTEAEWPERLVASIDYLRELLTGYGASGVPFYLSEWGANLNTDYPGSYPMSKREHLQAAAAVRSNLLCDMLSIHLGTWYEWHPTDADASYSISATGGRLRPSNDALTRMAAEMDGFTFQSRIHLPSSDDYALVYTRGPECKLVIWTYEADTEHMVSIPVTSPAASLNARDMYGNGLTLANMNGCIRPCISATPMYIDITDVVNGNGADALNLITPTSLIGEDIGAVGVTGTDSLSNGIYTMEAGGSDIWGTNDKFRFLHQTMTGDGVIIARLKSVEAVNYWTKAGLMMRASTSISAENAFVYTAPSNNTRFHFRLTNAGPSESTGSSGGAPIWLKLERRGDLFTGYKSSDGVFWTEVGQQVISSMPATVEVGLALTSHDPSELATAVFDHVSLYSAGIDPFSNVALGQPATASTQQGSYGPFNTVDSDTGSRWSSWVSDDQWLVIDLGEEHAISDVNLYWGLAYATGYRLEVSDNGSDWTILIHVPNGQGSNEHIVGLEGMGRYLRVFCEDRTEPAWGFTLWEVEVYGIPVNP